MMLERIEAPVAGTDNPFVVKESDLDIFNEDNFDFFLPPKGKDSLDGDFIPSRRSSTRRSSIASANSSNSSMCSKSFNYDNEEEMSLASMDMTVYSVSSRRSRRRGRSSYCCDDSSVNSSTRSRRSIIQVPKKKVSFHNRIKIRGIPHLRDTSDSELSARWYQEDELVEIKSQAADIIKRAKASETLDGECLRGLHMSKKQQRRSLWVMALSCVLDEQKRQANNGERDPERLAKLYKSFSFCSEQMAIANGKSDAQAVRNMM